MPRKSAEAALIEQVSSEIPPPDAPYNLDDDEAAVWRQIVASVPAGYFMPQQYDSLGLLCQHIVEARLTKEQLDSERRRKKPKLREIADLKKIWMQETVLIQNMLRSMRLTHQSIWHAETAHNKQRQVQSERGRAADIYQDNEDDLTDA